MIWKRKKNPPLAPVDDIAEAREIRAEAQREYQVIKNQEPLVKGLVQALATRRAMNHFGDSIQITFTKR